MDLDRHYSECLLLATRYEKLTDSEILQFDVRFIRSQDSIAIYEGRGSGKILTAWEAYKLFSQKVFQQIYDKGAAAIVASPDEPSKTLKERRAILNISEDKLADELGCSVSDIEKAESAAVLNPIHFISKLARKLGIDDAKLSFWPNAGGNDALAVRLKEIGRSSDSFGFYDTLKFTEASWVAKKQSELASWLKLSFGRMNLFQEKDSFYGDSHYPAYKYGYYLAQKTRDILSLGDEPIDSMWRFCSSLGIPYICTELSHAIGGATIAAGDLRCIVSNSQGNNSNEWVRRVTIAHELAHLLWDPHEQLLSLKIDSYKNITEDGTTLSDYVEQRANAFAAEFLIPSSSIRFQKKDEATNEYIRYVMEKCGVSFHTAFYHLRNTDKIDKNEQVEYVSPAPTEEWRIKEAYTEYFFPYSTTPIAKRGLFSAYVAKAYQLKMLTIESASEFMDCSQKDFQASYKDLIEIFDETSG